MSELPAPVQRVLAVLRGNGYQGEVRMLPDATHSAPQAAAALGCGLGQIAKSIIFKASSGRHVLVVTSGANRVDECKVEALLGEKLGKADADFVRERTGFAIGGVAPVGHAMEGVVFIDRDLAAHDEIWAAAGHPKSLFPVSFAELQRLTGGRVATVA